MVAVSLIDQPDLIPQGLTQIVGKPKVGKSLFMLGLASAVAEGGEAFGVIKMEQREVLYFALEDSNWSLKSHVAKTQQTGPTGRWHFAPTGPAKSESAASFLEKHITEHPNVKLIVIDTWARFCGYDNVGSYAKTYDRLAEIKTLAAAAQKSRGKEPDDKPP